MHIRYDMYCMRIYTHQTIHDIPYAYPFIHLNFFSILHQLQKAIEGSTRSGVRLRPPLASFRDTIRKYSKPTQASAAPASPVSSSPPDTYHASSQVVPQIPLAPVQQQEEEAEVWIEGVKREIVVNASISTTGSSSGSSSPQTGSSTSKAGSPNGSPSQSPSSRAIISLASLRPAPEDKRDGDQESDDEEPL